MASESFEGAGGRISYPSVACDGELQFMGTDGTTYRYKEHITHGDCIDGGIIQMHRRTPGDDTSWVWRWDAEDVSVKGVVQGIGWAVKPEGELDLPPGGVPYVKRELNWVRVAQRFPVRIEVENPDPELFRMGASAVAIIQGPPGR